MIFEQRDNEEDMKFLNTFPQSIPTPVLFAIRAVFLLTCVGAENGTVLSLVTASVGFTMEGFPPGSLLPGLGMKLPGAEHL